MAKGTYYLGRVVKLGMLTQELFINAIIDAPVLNHGKYDWAITNVLDRRTNELSYLYGRLSKFTREGHHKLVVTEGRPKVDELAENLLVATSHFVYLPQFSGIAYLHVWNQIQEEIFPKRFASIIEAAYSNFFVQCNIEPVSDYGTFVAKLRDMDYLTEISAKVHPPNPLFGRLWVSLKDYIEQRNASEIAIKETSNSNNALSSALVAVMEEILSHPDKFLEKPLDITDAALLMAADGYGTGKVVGTQNGAIRTLRTSDTKRNFYGDKDPDPNELALLAIEQFQQVSNERDMRH